MRAVMMAVVATLFLIAATPCEASAPDESYAHATVRRVPVSITFTGKSVFLCGQLPPGSDDAAVVVEGPPIERVRLTRKGRVVLFWMGVRQYVLSGVPSFYLVDLHCPYCNGMAKCPHSVGIGFLDGGGAQGDARDEAISALAKRAQLKGVSGSMTSSEKADVIRGFWELEEANGLYAVKQNAIRIGPRGTFYHVLHLPAGAPEGKYTIKTYFMKDGSVVAVAENHLMVRKAGLVSWLIRMAEHRAVAYGILTVGIALIAGFTAGSIFRRGAKH